MEEEITYKNESILVVDDELSMREFLSILLKKDDTLIVAELSRLGRNMLEVMNLISYFNEVGVKMIFIRQPELNTFDNAHGMFMVSIYGYFAQTEREFVSMRTKQGLAAARASGKKLGRQKGQKIKTLIQNDLSLGSHSIIWNGNDESEKQVSSGFYYYKLNVNGKTEAVKKCLLLK